jgi:hypothetical protein
MDDERSIEEAARWAIAFRRAPPELLEALCIAKVVALEKHPHDELRRERKSPTLEGDELLLRAVASNTQVCDGASEPRTELCDERILRRDEARFDEGIADHDDLGRA